MSATASSAGQINTIFYRHITVFGERRARWYWPGHTGIYASAPVNICWGVN